MSERAPERTHAGQGRRGGSRDARTQRRDVTVPRLGSPALFGSAEILQLQRVAGNTVVERLLSRHMTRPQRTAGSADLHLQRHPVAPDSLTPKAITGTKQKWKVADYFGEDEKNKLEHNLIALIPSDASPTPQERVRALEIIDHEDPAGTGSGYEGAAARVTPDGKVHFNNTLTLYAIGGQTGAASGWYHFNTVEEYPAEISIERQPRQAERTLLQRSQPNSKH